MENEVDVDKEMLAVLTGEKSVEDSLNLEPASEPAKEEATTVPPTQDGESQAKPEEGDAVQTDDSPKDDAETDPVVLAKDGEHTLPYSVVEGLRAQVADLTGKLDAATRTGDVEELAEIPKYSEDDLELVKEEMPEIAEALTKLVEERQGLVDKINDLNTQAIDTENAKKQQDASDVQGVIDNNPKLAHIQANDPELFQKAVGIDQQLRDNPDYINMPMDKQFEKTVKVLETMYGDITVPGVKQDSAPKNPETSETPEKKEKPLPGKADIPVPNSLSDLPAGSPPEHDPLAALASKSPMDIINNFAGKTPDQIEQMVANLI